MKKELVFGYTVIEVRKMVQDRGNIKWTTLMLPEHAELLKELWEEDGKTHRPLLDPQEIESMNHELVKAFQQQCPITLSVYKNGNELDYSGKIKRMDKEKECVIIKGEPNGEVSVPFNAVTRVIIN
ncbi:YolD-like family protein [Virgibacillus kimchii]